MKINFSRRAPKRARQLSTATTSLCLWFFRCGVDVLQSQFSRSTISFAEFSVSTRCIFLLVRSFIDPTFYGIFVCGPLLIKGQIKRWLYLSVNVMSMKLLKYWRWDHQFTWSSEQHEGLAIVRQRRYLHFSFLTKSIGPVKLSNTNLLASRHITKREKASLSVDVRRLKTSWLKFPDLATKRERQLTTGKRAKRTKLDFRCPISAQPLVKPVVWFARAVVNWRSRSVAKSGNLSQDVFKRRTSTESEAFSLLVICLDANKFVLLSFFSFIRTIYPRVSTKLLPNDAKSPLPIDVRRS